MRFSPLDFFRRRPRLTRRLGHIATFTVAFGLGLAIAGWTLVCQGTRCPSIELLESADLVEAIEGRTVVWMSHGDQVTRLPDGFRVYASS